MRPAKQTGPTTLFISHGGGVPGPDAEVEWFIVEPRNDLAGLAQQVESLRRGGRTVIEVQAAPYEGKP